MTYDGNSETPEDINPSNFVFYMMKDVLYKEKEFEINEYVHPVTKKLVERFLHNLFSAKERGRLYSKIANGNSSRKFTGKSRLLTDDKRKSNFGHVSEETAHKSVQTERLLNICMHEEGRTVNSVRDINLKRACGVDKEVLSIGSKRVNQGGLNNYLHHNKFVGNLLISSKGGSTTSNSVAFVNEPEEKRRKLYVTKIGVDKRNNSGSIYMNKNVSSKCSRSNDMRYVNIKCNAKLQHIPISLHSLRGKGHASKCSDVHARPRRESTCSSATAISNGGTTNSFSYSPVNRNCNNLITKTNTNRLPPTSNRIQLQELKTYSRKSNENSCYLVSAIGSTTASLEQKYLVNQTGSTANKLPHTCEKVGARHIIESKVNANRNNVVSASTTLNGITLTNMAASCSRMTAPKSSPTENINVKLFTKEDITTTKNTCG